MPNFLKGGILVEDFALILGSAVGSGCGGVAQNQPESLAGAQHPGPGKRHRVEHGLGHGVTKSRLLVLGLQTGRVSCPWCRQPNPHPAQHSLHFHRRHPCS